MKNLLLVLLLTGCAQQQLSEDQMFVLLDRYGPRCKAMGFTVETDPEGTGRCVRALIQAERPQPTLLDNLGYGLRGAGEIMGGGQTPVRSRDFMCFSDCTSRYSASYCERLCTY